VDGIGVVLQQALACMMPAAAAGIVAHHGEELTAASLGLETLTPVQAHAQVVWWSSFEKKYEGEVAAEADIFGGEAGGARRADLRLRVTEHNILVIAKYYARIELPRLAELLGLTPAEVGALLPSNQP
jgi:hypothetical protein